MSELDWKKFQFITEMQTALLANAINVAKHGDEGTQKASYSGTGLIIDMDNVFFAANLIPKDMSAHEAACDIYGAIKKEHDWPYWALSP